MKLTPKVPTAQTFWETRDMEIDVLFAGVPVRDLVAATDWYEQLFGRPPDLPVNEDEVMWKIRDEAWLYVVVDPPRAGQALVAMAVPNLDDATTAIEQRGPKVASTDTIPDAGRKAYFVDPDGNTIAIIEVLKRD